MGILDRIIEGMDKATQRLEEKNKAAAASEAERRAKANAEKEARGETYVVEHFYALKAVLTNDGNVRAGAWRASGRVLGPFAAARASGDAKVVHNISGMVRDMGSVGPFAVLTARERKGKGSVRITFADGSVYEHRVVGADQWVKAKKDVDRFNELAGQLDDQGTRHESEIAASGRAQVEGDTRRVERALSADELMERARAFNRTETREAALVLLDPAALVDATGLLLRVFSSPGKVQAELSRDDVHTVRALATFHSGRYRALPQGQDRLDRDTVDALLALVGSSNLEAIPVGIRSRIAEHKQRHPSTDLLAAAALTAHAGTLSAVFQATGSRAALDATITVRARVLDFVPPDHSWRAGYLSNLSGALQARFQETGASADLSEAVEVAARALAVASPDDASYATILSTAGTAFAISFEKLGDGANLDEAIAAFRKAAEVLRAKGRGGPILSNLGMALGLRYERTASMDDLTEAIEASEAAVTGTPREHTEFPRTQTALASLLGTRSARTGERTDLDRAIELAGEALELTTRMSPERADRLSVLGALLDLRSRQTMVIADAEAAISVLEAALAAARSTGAGQAEYSSRLGIAYLQRALTQPVHSRKRADMDAAVDHLRRAVDSIPQEHSSLRAAWVANLAGALQDRYELVGATADLDEAIERMQQAAASTPGVHADYAGMLSNLGSLLGLQARRTRRDVDLEAAEHAISRALRARQIDDPGRPLDEFNLALILHDRFEQSGGRIHAVDAVELFGRAAKAETLRAHQRVLAVRLGCGLAAALGDWDTALAEYETAVELLAVAAWHGLEREDRVFGLSQAAGLASDAAAAALHADQPERAVALLEQARGVLLGHALDMRTDRTLIRGQDPDLADRMDTVRAQLDQADRIPLPVIPVGTDNPAGAWQPRVSVSEQSRRRQELSREWDTLVAQARTLPGLTGFLRPLTFGQLRHAADEGPVLIVNASRHRCDLLIMSARELRVVPLPDIDVHGVADEAAKLQQALTEAYNSPDQLRRADSKLRETLAWLWDHVVSLAVQELGLVPADHEDAPLPRLWWCPTGIMSFLPLHAAGHYPSFGKPQTAGRTLLDYAASSHTPTLRALIDARQRSRTHGTSGATRVLTFALPETPGLKPLPQVKAEIQMLQARFPRMTSRIGPNASRSELLAQLPHHDVLHFSGHGGQDPLDPTRAILCTYDQPTALSDLIRLEVTHAHLAFLSACQTAVGAVSLPDESIHISGALQLAGFPHVIATQWSISDSIAPQVAERLYELLTEPGNQRGNAVDAHRAGEILNHVLRSLRDRYPPIFWAPFVHSGP
jgi:tetratricopeptide (TPR) repeat protein